MQQKTRLFTFGLSVIVLLTVSLGVNAEEKQTESETMVEYETFDDVLEEIQMQAGDIRYLSSVVLEDGIYQAFYLDAETMEICDSSVSPRMFITVTREFVKGYTSYDAIPESFYYEGWDSELNTWVWGTVYLQSAIKNGNYWTATFRGTLQGQI